MREYDDNIRLYSPVLQRIIILVAIIVAVPVMLWTITAFVRSYVGPPRIPTFQHMTTASVAPPDDAASADTPLPGSAEARATTTDVRTALLEFRKPAAADPAQSAVQPVTTAPQAQAPTLALAPAPTTPAPQIAAPAPANTTPAAQDKSDRVALAPNAAATPSAPAAPILTWPSPPPVPPPAPDANADSETAIASQEPPDAMAAASPIRGPIPLPRRRPTLYAMAQASASGPVPVPRPRPQAAGPAASDTPPGPLDWLGKLFQPQPNSPASQ